MIKLNIGNETDKLRSVILGIPPIIPLDKTKHDNLTERDKKQTREIKKFENILEENGVKIYRPQRLENIDDKIQIFTRDIGFVIGKYFIKGNMKFNDRQIELEAITPILEKINPKHIITPPDYTDIEGGDVLLWNKYIFVGISGRTNIAGYQFIKEIFNKYQVIPIDVFTSREDRKNILHLDCTFQPIGEEHALIYEDGFKRKPEVIYDLFKEKNLIKVDSDEVFNLATNVLSISKSKIFSEKKMTRINEILKKIGFSVYEIPYYNVSRCGGSFRCSTLPLCREN